MSDMRDLIDGEAMLDDEEDDESFNEDEEGTGEARKKLRDTQLDDSSEEEEDDDDEEEARRVYRAPILPDGLRITSAPADSFSPTRFAKASSSTRMKRMRATAWMNANAGRRRSAAALSGKRRNSLMKRTLISSAKLSQSGSGSHNLRFVLPRTVSDRRLTRIATT